jgi:hypothetical protein
MAEGYDPSAERERLETAVDEDMGGGETRRLYIKTATQDGNLVAVSVEAAPGTYLSWDDLDDLKPKAKKLAGETKAAPKRKTTRANPSGNGRRRRKAT